MFDFIMYLIAAVLFLILSLNNGINIIWMCIAGGYLLLSIIHLIIWMVKRKKKAAQGEK